MYSYNNQSFLFNYGQDYSSIAMLNPNSLEIIQLLPSNEYKSSQDKNPKVVKPSEKLNNLQEVQYRFLEPQATQISNDLAKRKQHKKKRRSTLPLVVRQDPPKPDNPAPLILREIISESSKNVSEQVANVLDKSTSTRKVVVERLPSSSPKPQQVFLDKWLGYKQQKKRVVFKPDESDSKNLNIQSQVEIIHQLKDLGTQQADPSEYVKQHGNILLSHQEFVEAARTIGAPDAVLAEVDNDQVLPELEGDLQALRLVDLDKNGLSKYKSYLRKLGLSYDNSRFQGKLVTSSDTSGLISYEQALAIVNNVRTLNDAELKAYFDSNGEEFVSSDIVY